MVKHKLINVYLIIILIPSHIWFNVYFFFNISVFFLSAELFYLSHKLVDLYPNNPVSIDHVSPDLVYII